MYILTLLHALLERDGGQARCFSAQVCLDGVVLPGVADGLDVACYVEHDSMAAGFGLYIAEVP